MLNLGHIIVGLKLGLGHGDSGIDNVDQCEPLKSFKTSHLFEHLQLIKRSSLEILVAVV